MLFWNLNKFVYSDITFVLYFFKMNSPVSPKSTFIDYSGDAKKCYDGYLVADLFFYITKSRVLISKDFML